MSVGSLDTANCLGRNVYAELRLFLSTNAGGCEGFSLRLPVSYELGTCKAAPLACR